MYGSLVCSLRGFQEIADVVNSSKSMLIMFPSVSILSLLISVILAFVVAWCLIDSSFRSTIDLAAADLGISKKTGMNLRGLHRINALGGRLALAWVVFIASIYIWSGISFNLILGDARDRRLIWWLVAFLLATLCVALLANLGKLTDHATCLRLKWQLPKFVSAAKELASQWPTKDGCIDGIGCFTVDTDYPEILVLTPEVDYPVLESVGGFVRKKGDASIHFDLALRPECRLEFHQNGALPSSQAQTFGDITIKYKVRYFVQITSGVFYVSYYTDSNL